MCVSGRDSERGNRRRLPATGNSSSLYTCVCRRKQHLNDFFLFCMIVRTYGIYYGSSGDITCSVVSSKFLAPVTTFRQYLERIPLQSQPMFRFILLAFAIAGRLDTVFKSDVDREKLLCANSCHDVMTSARRAYKSYVRCCHKSAYRGTR